MQPLTSTLSAYGWSPSLEHHVAQGEGEGRSPARVVMAQRGIFRLQTATGPVDAVVSGRLRHLAENAEDLPVVGDWVLCHQPDTEGMALIDSVLPRHSKLSRKVAGDRAVEQVLAANVDRILIVMGLDGDYNLRRLERYLVMARESGAQPLVVLNKADLSADPGAARSAVEAIAKGAPVLAITGLTDDLDVLRQELTPGETVALVGSSGAGKSTLINRLAEQEVLRTGPVRESDERGQHTTTHRELFLLPGGYLLIDNPGLRELQLWSADEGLDDAFDDLLLLAEGCRFRNCSHSDEPGCAIDAAIESGDIEPERLASFHALAREARSLAARRDERTKRAADKRLGRLYKSIQEQNRKLKGY